MLIAQASSAYRYEAWWWRSLSSWAKRVRAPTRGERGGQPRPTNEGIVVAITVNDWTLASSGSPAM